ncbi:kinase-like domain-containing protein [Armillaria luteobubalina]|uniref:Kinase-like domain-containing protein n=1 Tax=Armillaria luteobubalina TaxID=153913 RepID=A0AA39P434_9AGAR|nr:kinase-like domain-containing protein [Armillaria luteobubalina]
MPWRLPQPPVEMIAECILTVFYTAVIAIADILLACFGPIGRLPYRSSADVDDKTDDEIVGLCQTVPVDEWESHRPPRLTPDVVVKLVPKMDGEVGWPAEALAQDLIKNRTNIPVPPIRRVLNVDIDESFIVMDFIPGITLAAAWPTMGLWQKLRIAFILRSYVRQLWSITHPRSQIPGPVLDGEQPAKCYASRIFGPVRPIKGPFPTSADLIRFFNKAMDRATLAEGYPHWAPLPDDGTLIYSHIDLALRNLILGEDGQLWLIDFATAGFYPTWFEYVNMVIDAKWEGGPEYDSIWWAIIPFVADPVLPHI